MKVETLLDVFNSALRAYEIRGLNLSVRDFSRSSLKPPKPDDRIKGSIKW